MNGESSIATSLRIGPPEPVDVEQVDRPRQVNTRDAARAAGVELVASK